MVFATNPKMQVFTILCYRNWLRSPVLWYVTVASCILVGGYETLYYHKWLGHLVVSCVDMAF
jgi:hypothetical protein